MNLIKAQIDMMLNPLHLWTGVENGKFKELPQTPNGVSTQTEQSEKRVPVLPYVDGSKEASKAKIKAALASMPDTIKVVKEEDNYYYVIFVSAGMKFKDDVEFYFDDAEKVVHFRSNSRIGFSDMGVNQKRYDTIAKFYLA